MIITCPNCEKKFQIDPTLVPENGRDLQCGSCNHAWFYKPENQIEAPLSLNENTFVKTEKTKIETEVQKIKINKETKKEKKKEPRIKKEIPKIIEKPTNRGSKLFSYLIVFIISFVALVILLDTLKTPLISVFPGLEIILFNLFETLQDLKLFIIDLT